MQGVNETDLIRQVLADYEAWWSARENTMDREARGEKIGDDLAWSDDDGIDLLHRAGEALAVALRDAREREERFRAIKYRPGTQ